MILVFDFDGHLYSGEKVFENVYDWVNSHRREFFPNLTDEQYNRVLEENPNLVKVVSGKDIAAEIHKACVKYPELNIDINDFWTTQYNQIYDINLNGAHFADTEFVKTLTNLFNCYVVSNSAPTHIYYYMGKIGIEPNGFKKIISNKFTVEDQSKQHYYIDIAKWENVSYDKLYVYGDSYGADLKPAEEIGSNVCHTTDSHMFKENVINTIKKEMEIDSTLEKTLIDRYIEYKNCYEKYSTSAECRADKSNAKQKELDNMLSLLNTLGIKNI